MFDSDRRPVNTPADCRAALRMIRETIETLGPYGALPWALSSGRCPFNLPSSSSRPRDHVHLSFKTTGACGHFARRVLRASIQSQGFCTDRSSKSQRDPVRMLDLFAHKLILNLPPRYQLRGRVAANRVFQLSEPSERCDIRVLPRQVRERHFLIGDKSDGRRLAFLPTRWRVRLS